MLMGSYTLDSVDLYVTKASPGVYVLSRDGRVASYVGRSDTDVGSRIKQSANERTGYTHFWFAYLTSSKEAYGMECDLYHKYNPADNTHHPAAPFGTNWKCPVIGCPWS